MHKFSLLIIVLRRCNLVCFMVEMLVEHNVVDFIQKSKILPGTTILPWGDAI